MLTTPNVQLKVQFAEKLSAEGLLTAICRIFGPQKFLAIRYKSHVKESLKMHNMALLLLL